MKAYKAVYSTSPKIEAHEIDAFGQLFIKIGGKRFKQKTVWDEWFENFEEAQTALVLYLEKELADQAVQIQKIEKALDTAKTIKNPNE